MLIKYFTRGCNPLARRVESESFAHRPYDNPNGLTLESWAQGYMVGSLLIMAAIAIANMRKHAILHKLILTEVSGFINNKQTSWCQVTPIDTPCVFPSCYSAWVTEHSCFFTNRIMAGISPWPRLGLTFPGAFIMSLLGWKTGLSWAVESAFVISERSYLFNYIGC